MNNKQRTTNNETRDTSREHRAFTLIELVVSIALLVMVVAFAGVIFQRSIGSYRTAGAQAEIMRKLRAITEQLNSDFRGIQKDAPMAIWFQEDANNVRYDRIAFFAAGDFQSVRQYQYNGSYKTVAGNVASILYMPDISNPSILIRKQKILTSDDTLTLSPVLIDPNEFIKDSLAAWKVRPANLYFSDWIYSPAIDLRLEEDIPRYAASGVSNFTIQLSDDLGGVLGWTPASPADFPTWDINLGGFFGSFFNISGGVGLPDWQPANWPRAIKFTFTLHDSMGVFKKGQTFTHIVYLGD
jgi:prepilin-type N-terminal cleavage/methylation domain-containing protein